MIYMVEVTISISSNRKRRTTTTIETKDTYHKYDNNKLQKVQIEKVKKLQNSMTYDIHRLFLGNLQEINIWYTKRRKIGHVKDDLTQTAYDT